LSLTRSFLARKETGSSACAPPPRCLINSAPNAITAGDHAHTVEVELADGRRGVFDLRPFLDRAGMQRLKDPHQDKSAGR